MKLPHGSALEVTLGSKAMPGILFPRQVSSPALESPEGISGKLLPAGLTQGFELPRLPPTAELHSRPEPLNALQVPG